MLTQLEGHGCLNKQELKHNTKTCGFIKGRVREKIEV